MGSGVNLPHPHPVGAPLQTPAALFSMQLLADAAGKAPQPTCSGPATCRGDPEEALSSWSPASTWRHFGTAAPRVVDQSRRTLPHLCRLAFQTSKQILTDSASLK